MAPYARGRPMSNAGTIEPRGKATDRRGAVDAQPDPGRPSDFRPLGFRDVRLLFRTESAGRPHGHVLERGRDVDEPQQVREDPPKAGRAHRQDLRIAAHDQGVGVVPGVAPPPDRRIAHLHERRDLVDDVVLARGGEERPVSRLVPPRVRGRPVQHPVGGQRRQCGPLLALRPGDRARGAGQRHGSQPDRGVLGGVLVGAAHEFLHALAGDRATEPRAARQAFVDGLPAFGAGQVVAGEKFASHERNPSTTVRRITRAL